jgi:transcriptional regulator with XRE-family HTH domain
MGSMGPYKDELARWLQSFGANVRQLRLSQDPPLSQERLASAVGLHRNEIGKIEQGAIEPRLTTLVILAEGLNVSLDELVTGLSAPVERRPTSIDPSQLVPPK